MPVWCAGRLGDGRSIDASLGQAGPPAVRLAEDDWNEQIARRPLYLSWPSYAAAFAMAPLAYFVLTSLPAGAAAAIALCMPAASCAMLARSARAGQGAEPAAETVSRAWRFPWRPALLMAAFSFSHHMLMHLSGGTSAFGQLGSLVAAGAVLLAATALFDRLDLGVLYRAAAPLMMCALLCLPLGGVMGTGARAATRREEEVLSLLAQGRSAPEVEAELYISHNTAKGHIRHLYAKLGVHSREEAVAVVSGWR